MLCPENNSVKAPLRIGNNDLNLESLPHETLKISDCQKTLGMSDV